MKQDKVDLIIRRCVKIFNEDSLREKLMSGEKLTIKFGADPSRPDLHLGHSIGLRLLKDLQDLGHDIIFLIGDFTAMIGDPSGKNKTRPALTFEETRKSGQTYMKQVVKILDPEKTIIKYNSEWLSKMNFEDILNLTGKYTVARLLERDDFNNRFNNNAPIGLHEFMYPLMQGYDSVAIKADVEIGGTDQTFNLLVGRELQKDYGQRTQDVIILPLLVGLDGKEKMSKSLDNYIGITDESSIMYEKCMKIPDSVLLDYFKLTTDLKLIEIEKIMSGDIIEAHKKYAYEIIKMYHGEEFIKEAEEKYITIAKGGMPTDIKEIMIKYDVINQNFTLIDALLYTKLFDSKSEAKRMIEQSGISLNGIKETNKDKVLISDDFIDNILILQKGKRTFVKLVIEN